MRLLKFYTYPLALLLFILTVGSCKKKDTNSGQASIAGTWIPLSDTTQKYFIADANGSAYFLYQGPYGIRESIQALYQINSESTLLLSNSGSSAVTYSYRKNADSLILESTNDRKIFKKTNDVVDKSIWTRTATLSEFHNLSFVLQFGNLEGDGTYFYINSALSGKRMYKVDAATFAVVDSNTLPNKTFGFTLHQSKIWVTDNNTPTNNLYNFNFTTGAYSFTSAAHTTPPILPFSNGAQLFAFDKTTKDLLEYNTLANSFSLVKALPGFPLFGGFGSGGGDVAYQGGYLYFPAYNYILKFNLTTYRFEDTYVCTEGFITGLHSDGTTLWASGVMNYTGLTIDTKPFIAKLNLN